MDNPITTSRLAFLALCAILASCSSGHGEEGCPELCERKAACANATQTEDACRSECESTTAAVEEAGCESQWDAYLECVSHANDTCDQSAADEECSVQLQAKDDCLKP